jgi:hypothetical protein
MLVSVLSFASTASAATVALQSVDVTLHSEESGGVLLVSGHLPDSAKLPAQVGLSVPAGSTLSWIGELLGGATSEDPALTYTKSAAGGLDTYLVTLTKARTAQIEIAAPGAVSSNGADYSAVLSWTAPADVSQVTMSVRIPAASQITSAATGASVHAGDESYAFYSKTFDNVKAGDTPTLAFAYSATGAVAGSAGAAGGPSSSGSTAIVVVALLLGGLVGLVLVILGSRTARARRRAESDTAAPAVQPRRRSIAARGDESAFDDTDDTDDAVQTPIRRGLSTQAKLTAATVLVLALAVGIVVTQSQRPVLVGDTVSRVFASGEPCDTTQISVTAPAGGDPIATAETLFAGLKPMDGINTAAYNVKTKLLDVGYCGSKTTEAAVRSALASTGLVAASGGVANP